MAKRIKIMSTGTLGDTRSLTGGLFESKIRYGPGYRLYFVNKGKRIIVLLCGGDKSTQKRDIKRGCCKTPVLQQQPLKNARFVRL
ncbi:MAG: type II toxin-antitoxin system RelE/ParE family toxin [Treponema sp.]|nr:type II toxin-antitoxin system RelE/ParE family toxin [Treponema sp.]